MKITVSILGRHSAFDLARELYRLGHLHQLITSYPTYMAVRFGVPRQYVTSLLANEIPRRYASRLPNRIERMVRDRDVAQRFYDFRAARKLRPESDVWIGWPGASLRQIQTAKRRGVLTIVKQGVAHIEFRDAVFREESRHWSIPEQRLSMHQIEREKAEYEAADYIEVMSTFARQSFIDRGYDPERILVNALGVDLEQFTPGEKRDDVFRAIYAGQVSFNKGVPYVVQAFAECGFQNAELLLVGNIHENIRPVLQPYAESFRYVGPVRQDELSTLYTNSTVFVFGSVLDGFGMVVPQAMACGLPVIVTENTGSSDLITHGQEGFITPIRDVEQIKRYLRLLYDDPDLRSRMGRAARERVADGHSWTDHGVRAATMYEELLQRRG